MQQFYTTINKYQNLTLKYQDLDYLLPLKSLKVFEILQLAPEGPCNAHQDAGSRVLCQHPLQDSEHHLGAGAICCHRVPC